MTHKTHICRQCGSRIDSAELTATREREAKLQAEIERLEGLVTITHLAAEEAITFKKENANLRGVVERLRRDIQEADGETSISGYLKDRFRKALAESAEALGNRPPMSEGEKYFEDKQPYPDEP